MEAADTGSYDNAYAVFVYAGAFLFKLGVGHGLTGSHEGILGIEVECALFFAVEVL